MVENLQNKVTFGVIVFNGEPFTKYCLRQIYPFAHEIIVVEGATVHAKDLATESGHSRDGTVEALEEFKRTEDPENKLAIVTKERFWLRKDEMSQAYAERATGDYLWQIDIDEFYKTGDILAVLQMLNDDPAVTAVSFKTVTIWGGPDYAVQSYKDRIGDGDFHRLFKWGPGYRYVTHRPPTVIDAEGRDLRRLKHIDSKAMARLGIYLYHYSMLFPKQVREKCHYYEGMDWDFSEGLEQWVDDCYQTISKPFRVSLVKHIPSWLSRYEGEYPEAIQQMAQDVRSGRVKIPFRKCEDIESLLGSRSYRLRRFFVKSPIAFGMWWVFSPYGRHHILQLLSKMVGPSNADMLLAVWRRLKNRVSA